MRSKASRPKGGAVTALAVISGLSLLASSCTTESAKSPVRVVPLRTSFSYSLSNGLPVITVKIGGDRPVNLLFDTGSTGIRVFAKDVPAGPNSGIRTTGQSASVTYNSGLALKGTVAVARISVGGLRTSSIPFELVTSCSQGCSSGALSGEGAGPISGIFGAGLRGPTLEDPEENPLQALPGRYGESWTVRVSHPATSSSTGSVVLGGAPPSATSEVIKLKPEAGGRERHWNDLPVICWTFGSTNRFCTSSYFDSGSDNMVIQAPRLPPELHATTGYTTVPPNTTITASAPGARRPFWEFDTGTLSDFNEAITRLAAPAFLESGIQAFEAMNVTYDTVRGELIFSHT
jgi:Eukaryotic aspartyl protease